jgi:hypothetical protein
MCLFRSLVYYHKGAWMSIYRIFLRLIGMGIDLPVTGRCIVIFDEEILYWPSGKDYWFTSKDSQVL